MVDGEEAQSIAAHELGHGVAWEHAGLTVYKLEMSASFGGSGFCSVRGVVRGERGERGYLIGYGAGYMADQIWRERHEMPPPDPRTAGGDYELYQQELVDHPELVGLLSWDEAVAAAAPVVMAYWDVIEQRVPVLVDRHRLGGV